MLPCRDAYAWRGNRIQARLLCLSTCIAVLFILAISPFGEATITEELGGEPLLPTPVPAETEPEETESDCTPHPKIAITEEEGQQGFTLGTEPVTGEPIYRPGSGVAEGQGTADDPFVIKGWCIQAGPLDPGIRIEGTEAHVTVRENVFTSEAILGGKVSAVLAQGAANISITENSVLNGLYGLVLIDVEEPRVIDNDVSVDRHGIISSRTDGGTLADNRLHENGWDGIRLYKAANLRVQGNEATDNGLDGIEIHYGKTGIEILDNVVHGNGWAYGGTDSGGIAIRNTSRVSVEQNALEGNTITMHGEKPSAYEHEITASNTVNGDPVRYLHDAEGQTVEQPAGQVVLANTSDVTVRTLTVNDTNTGLKALYSERLTIEGNTFADNDVALTVSRTSNLTLVNNTAIRNEEAIQVRESDHPEIARNQFTNNGDPLRVESSQRPVVRLNEFHENEGGLALEDILSPTVTMNKLSQNDQGITIRSAEGGQITDNILKENEEHGIAYFGSIDGRIADNQLVHRTGKAIFLSASQGSAIDNNTVRGGSYGIHLRESSATVANNSVEESNYGISSIRSGQVSIKGNLLDGHGFGVIQWETKNLNVSENEVRNTTSAAIHLSNTEHAKLRHNVLGEGNMQGLSLEDTGSAVDARHNWWNATSGPSGNVQDACSSATADGRGASIVVENATVCFEPWLQAPPD